MELAFHDSDELWASKALYIISGYKSYQTVPACIAEDTVRALLMSLVNTAATSPKSELLALSITSSIVLNRKISWTGPKICNKIMYAKTKSVKLDYCPSALAIPGKTWQL